MGAAAPAGAVTHPGGVWPAPRQVWPWRALIVDLTGPAPAVAHEMRLVRTLDIDRGDDCPLQMFWAFGPANEALPLRYAAVTDPPMTPVENVRIRFQVYADEFGVLRYKPGCAVPRTNN